MDQRRAIQSTSGLKGHDLKAQGKASERSELAAALGRRPATTTALKGRYADVANETTNIPPFQGYGKQRMAWSQGSALGCHMSAFQAGEQVLQSLGATEK